MTRAPSSRNRRVAEAAETVAPRVARPAAAGAMLRVSEGRRAGLSVIEACRDAGISVPTYYRWRGRSDPATRRISRAASIREAILEAAKVVFLKRGYRVSLAEIADEAGVARQTVYNQFGGKDELFRDVVQALFRNIVRPILIAEKHSDLIVMLREYGRYYLRMALDEDTLGLFRVTLGEFQEFPELARMTFAIRTAHAIPVLTDHIADYLSGQIEEGLIDPVDPLLAAEAFCGSFTSHARYRALVGIGHDSPERLEAMLDLAVAVFARGLGYRRYGETGSGANT